MTKEEFFRLDWIKYLERRRSCFIYFPYIEAETKYLEKTTGFGYNRHLFKWSGDKGEHFRSATELEDSLAHYLRVIKEEPDKVIGWTKKSHQWTKRTEEMVSLFQDNAITNAITLKDFQTYYEEFVQILLWTVTVPYLALSAIDTALENGEPKEQFERVLEYLEPIRGYTAYPQLERSMLNYFWQLLSEESGIKDMDLIDKLNPDEIKGFIEGKVLPNEDELKKRKEWCLFFHFPDSEEIIYEYNKAFIKEIPVLTGQETHTMTLIQGRVGYPGVVKGMVKRIDNAKDMAKFNPGDIIVSINTTPDLMAVLSECGAIVSDEGGIMCHAAIVSRELKKPCVIGTKIATKVLKDGDIVEVDAEKGIIRILQ